METRGFSFYFGGGEVPMRVYECEYYKVTAPDTCCLFCSHCTDVFWDFTHGPYMFFCDVDADTEEGE